MAAEAGNEPWSCVQPLATRLSKCNELKQLQPATSWLLTISCVSDSVSFSGHDARPPLNHQSKHLKGKLYSGGTILTVRTDNQDTLTKVVCG